MSKSMKIILGTAVAILLIIVMGVASVTASYNNLIILENNIESKYATIEVMLQRRLDLIPNLVKTADAYMDHESDTYKAISAYREGLLPYVEELADGSMKIKDNLTQEEMEAFTNKVMDFTVEAYPELSSDLMKDLMVNLEGSENRIAVARRDYNNALQEYNNKRETFPTVIIANLFDFTKYEMFEASENAYEVPEVNFD